MAKKIRRAKRQTDHEDQRSSEPVHLVVRRGSLRRFDALKTKTEDLPVVVSWDRRTGDRGTDADGQRAIERRQEPPFPWDLADFVVVSKAPKSAPPRKSKSAPANSAKPRLKRNRQSTRRS